MWQNNIWALLTGDNFISREQDCWKKIVEEHKLSHRSVQFYTLAERIIEACTIASSPLSILHDGGSDKDWCNAGTNPEEASTSQLIVHFLSLSTFSIYLIHGLILG